MSTSRQIGQPEGMKDAKQSYTMDTDFIRQSSVTPSGSIIAFV
jgi:hypothetical protein